MRSCGRWLTREDSALLPAEQDRVTMRAARHVQPIRSRKSFSSSASNKCASIVIFHSQKQHAVQPFAHGAVLAGI